MADSTFNIGAAIQDVLTRGLDYAVARVNTRLTVNDPTGAVTGPNGTRVAVGQSAVFASTPGGVPLWVWIAGAAAAGVAVFALLKR